MAPVIQASTQPDTNFWTGCVSSSALNRASLTSACLSRCCEIFSIAENARSMALPLCARETSRRATWTMASASLATDSSRRVRLDSILTKRESRYSSLLLTAAPPRLG